MAIPVLVLRRNKLRITIKANADQYCGQSFDRNYHTSHPQNAFESGWNVLVEVSESDNGQHLKYPGQSQLQQ